MEGKYIPKTKFLSFVENKGRKTDIKEALLSGRYFSLDEVTFLVKIYDDGSIDFDEKDTKLTTEEQRRRFIEMIEDKSCLLTIVGCIINELDFKSIDTDKSLSLVIEKEAPYSKLNAIMEEKNIEVKLTKSQKTKINQIFDLFDDDEIKQPVEKIDNDDDKVLLDFNPKTDNWLKSSFDSIKEEKRVELSDKLEKTEIELRGYQAEQQSLQLKIIEKEKEIALLNDRLKSLNLKKSLNGYYFFVSERQNEKVNLDEDVKEKMIREISKVKSINVDALMKLFTIGEYHITLFDVEKNPADIKNLPLEITKELLKLKLSFNKKLFVYNGEMDWHQIVDYLVNLGFAHLSVIPKQK